VKCRLCASPSTAPRLALTAQALASLDVRNAGPFGAPAAVNIAVSGPRGALLTEAAVCRAGPRLLLPEAVARRLGFAAGEWIDVEVPSWPEPLDHPVLLESPAGLREALLVLDGPAAERPLDGNGTLTARLSLRAP
jgi:hypothetical protein